MTNRRVPCRRELAQGRGHRLEEPEAVVLRVARVLFEGRGVFTQTEDEAGELGELPVGHPRDPIGRLGVEVPAERLGEGLKRRHRLLVTTAPQDERALALHGTGELARRGAVLPMPGSPSTRRSPPSPCDRPTPTSRATTRTPARAPRADPRSGRWGCARGSPSPIRAVPPRSSPRRPGHRLPAPPGTGKESAGSWERMACSIHDTSWPGLDPELGDEGGAQVLEHAQGLGLATRAVERQHALRPQALAHRMLARQRLQLADQRLVAAQGHRRVDARLDRRQQQLLEAARLGPGEGLVPHLAVGRATPELLGARTAARTDSLGRAPSQQTTAVGHHLLEHEERRSSPTRPRARTPGRASRSGPRGRPLAGAVCAAARWWSAGRSPRRRPSWSPHSESTSRSTDTMRPRSMSRRAIRARALTPPRSTTRPPQAISSGPSTRICNMDVASVRFVSASESLPGIWVLPTLPGAPRC